MKIRQHLTCVIAAQFLLAATAPAFTADACGTFRDQLKRYVRTDPGSGADYGDATFVRAALESYLAQPDLREGGCEALEKKLRAFGTDLSIMPRDLSDFFCTENTDLYDGSPYEGAQYGMILLNAYVGTGCYQMQQIDKSSGTISLGGFQEVCWPDQLLVLREGKRLSPTVLEVRTKGPELTYRLHVHGSLGNREDCSIDVVYDPTFRVVHWLGPNGEDDVDPRLRSAVEPILLERAAGHDADSLTTLLLDRSQGDSQYDRFISDHPVVPIAVPPPNRVDAEAINPENWLPITIPFGDKLASPADRGTYASYDGIDGDVTPLRVDGRHLLLAFGFPVFNDVHQLPDFGFGIWAWDGHDFQAVAGGYMGKSGNHPYIH